MLLAKKGLTMECCVYVAAVDEVGELKILQI